MNARTRQKLIMKRKRRGFKSIFLRRFIPLTVIFGVLFVIYMYLLDFIMMITNQYYLDSSFSTVVDKIPSEIDRYQAEQAEERLKYYLHIISYDSNSNMNEYNDYSYYKLYDIENEETVYTTDEKFTARINGDKGDVPPTFYYADASVLGKAYDDYIELLTSDTDQRVYYDIYAYDIYISNDGTLLPGKVELIKYTDSDDDYGNVIEEKLQEYDLTPENTSGYEHIIFDIDNGVGYATLCGVHAESPAIEKLDNDLYESDHATKKYTNTTAAVTESIHSSAITVNGKKYMLICASCASNRDVYLWSVRTGGIAAGVIVIVLSLILAYIRYVSEQAHYAVEDSRREMTNAMAHDLKSPLMAISGCAENLKNDIVPDKREHYAELILSNVEYMNGIIANVLDLAKSEETGVLKKTDTDLRAITECALSKYTDILSENGVTAEIQGSGVISADRAAMTQVIENLISNAVKYTQNNGRIDIYISTKNYTVENDSSEQTGKTEAELWKPFVKGDNSRSAKRGSGLGLSIVKNLCDRHGFKTSLEMSDGKFKVMIKF